MWNTTRDTSYLWRAPAIDKGRLMIADVNMRWHAFDLYNNGAELWVSEPAEYPWGAFWTYACACAYDKAYGTSYDGHVYAFDINTGDIVWSFYSGDSHGETPYGTWPFWGTTTVADGKVYASTTEHTPTQPRGRGNNLFCINDADGKEIWRIAGAYANTKAIADGMLLASNEYDSMLYCFGKGPSATTVTATAGVGNAITIQGTVTDISGGAKQLIEQNLFNIVPAVSDDE
jgi:outer membrane protein assembly factor BamB